MKSLAHQFLDFCRSKPEGDEYAFMECEKCALAQFFVATGYATAPIVGETFWFERDGPNRQLPAVLVGPVKAEPHTFGALASRLEAALSEG